MTRKQHTGLGAGSRPGSDINPPLDGVSDRIRQIRALVEAAQIVNDRSLSPRILRAAAALIVDAQRTLSGGAA